MIQTQLLKLDPPYQIISANGHVGIQVATMIEAREIDMSRNRFGHIANYIEYHSYPVVNYGLKQGLEEELKYNNDPTDDFAEYKINSRMQPEGAVWSGVEVKDVHVLGLAGAKNRAVTLDRFLSLVPTIPGFDPNLCVWDTKSTSCLYELYFGLGKVGIETPTLPEMFLNKKKNFSIRLQLERSPLSNGFLICVVINENPYVKNVWDNSNLIIEFRCMFDPKDDDIIKECATTIAEALNGISMFLPTRNLDITWTPYMNDNTLLFSDELEQLTDQVVENYKGLR